MLEPCWRELKLNEAAVDTCFKAAAGGILKVIFKLQ